MSENNNKTIADVKQSIINEMKGAWAGEMLAPYARTLKLLCEAESIEARTKQEAEYHPLQMDQLRNQQSNLAMQQAAHEEQVPEG